MAKLGPNVKTHIEKGKRAQLRAVMVEVFEAKVLKSDDQFDIYDLEGTRFGAQVIDDGEALSTTASKERGTWLEVLVDDPGAAKRSLERLGIEAFSYFDKTHDYFQLPGGQVVRVAARS